MGVTHDADLDLIQFELLVSIDLGNFIFRIGPCRSRATCKPE
jgi:hypothetical protein